jgi:hypothetical protein
MPSGRGTGAGIRFVLGACFFMYSTTSPRDTQLITSGLNREPLGNVREHAWGDGPGVRCCAGACSGEVRVVEAAAQVSSLRLIAPTGAACAARILAAAASPAPAFASPVFLVTCAFGDAAVGEGGEGGCRSCQEGNRRQICPLVAPPPAHVHGELYAFGISSRLSGVVAGC